MFSWVDVLTKKGYPFVTHGQNVGKNDIAIACPFCGDDPSAHMNLSVDPERPYYYCFRNSNHKGVNPYRLLALLFGGQAAQDIMEEAKLEMPTQKAPVSSPEKVFLIEDIGAEQADDASILQEYLVHIRDMKDEVLADTIKTNYDLRLGHTGGWMNRVVVPIMDNHHKILGATGRALSANEKSRYFTKKADHCPPFLGGQYLYSFTENIVLCEGPFDVLKLSYLFMQANWFLGTEVTPLAYMGERIRNDHLVWLVKNAGADAHIYILSDYDNDNIRRARNRAMYSQLSPFFTTYILDLPKGVKDPDQLTSDTVVEVISQILLHAPSKCG